MIKKRFLSAFGMMTALCSMPAFAQAAPDRQLADARSPSAVSLGQAGDSVVPPQLDAVPPSATASLQPWQPLADKGVKLTLSYIGEFAANPVGGIRHDAAFAGQLYAGADFDMEKLAGLRGGTFHFAIIDRHGTSLSDIAIGNNTPVQEIYYKENFNLGIMTYEQKLFNGRLDIEIGKRFANTLFAHSDFYCTFESTTTCGNPIFIFRNSNISGYPSSTWMGHALYHLDDHLFVHAGVVETNPDRADPRDDGWNFSWKHANGVIVPYEFGYSNDGDATHRPAHYILGGWFDRGKYADPLLDDRGGVAVLSGRPSLMRRGRTGIFARFDQTLTHPDPNSSRGLSVFGIAMTNLGGQVVSTSFWELGLMQTGTFKGRDKDTIGFMINDERYSNLTLDAVRAARTSAGGSPDIPRHEYTMELNYGWQVMPALRLNPNLQYIINPDQQNHPFRTRDIPNAFVLGCRFTIDGPTLMAMALGRH